MIFVSSSVGGWVGFFSYDTVRYVETKKLPFSKAPHDDRNLPDIHLGLYNDVIVFDHVEKVCTRSAIHLCVSINYVMLYLVIYILNNILKLFICCFLPYEATPISTRDAYYLIFILTLHHLSSSLWSLQNT